MCNTLLGLVRGKLWRPGWFKAGFSFRFFSFTLLRIKNIIFVHRVDSNEYFDFTVRGEHSKHKGDVSSALEKSIHVMQKFPCNLCGYKAIRQSYLTTHKQSKHEEIKYSCTKCDKQFSLNMSTRAALIRQHIRLLSTHMSSQNI